MVIVWDEPKRRRNIEVHGLDFADVESFFDFRNARIGRTRPGPDGRPRLKAIGRLGEDSVVLIFCPLGTEAISLISLRPASRKERKSR